MPWRWFLAFSSCSLFFLSACSFAFFAAQETMVAAVVLRAASTACYVPRRPRAVICSAVSVSMCQQWPDPRAATQTAGSEHYTRACVAARRIMRTVSLACVGVKLPLCEALTGWPES